MGTQTWTPHIFLLVNFAFAFSHNILKRYILILAMKQRKQIICIGLLNAAIAIPHILQILSLKMIWSTWIWTSNTGSEP